MNQNQKKPSFWKRLIGPVWGKSVFRRQPKLAPDWNQLPKLLALRQTAKLLGVHANTLRLWDNQGRLRAVRIGSRADRRYPREVVQSLYEQRQETAWVPVVRPHPSWPLRAAIPMAVCVLIFSAIGLEARAGNATKTAFDFQPSTCTGWTNATAAETTNLSAKSDLEDFTSKNSAQFKTEDAIVRSGFDGGAVTDSVGSVSPILTCKGFTGDLPTKRLFDHADLLVTMGIRSQEASSDVVYLERSTDGKNWTNIKSFTVGSQPTGQFRFELANLTDPSKANGQQFRFRVETDVASPASTISVDGVLVELSYQAADVTSESKVKDAKKQLDKLTTFSKKVYSTDELPSITVPKKRSSKFLFVDRGQKTWRVSKVQAIDSAGKISDVGYKQTDEGTGSTVDNVLKVQTRTIHPGKYKLRVTTVDSDGITSTVEKEFTWGVIALNMNRALPAAHSVQTITMGVLDDAGHTICDANLKLVVTAPGGDKTTYRTKNTTIQRNKDCADKSYTELPDYYTSFLVDEPGAYQLHLEADAGKIHRVLEDSFEVQPTVQFDVNRVFLASRIYPLAIYTSRVAITPSADYQGIVDERVPTNFTIDNVLPGGEVKKDPDHEDTNVIEWLVDWKANETYYLSYTFDAPDVSPALFTVGPLSIGGTFTEGPLFQEPREWHIASDSVAGNAVTARVWSTGFELNSTTAGMEYTANVNTPTISNTTFRSGSYALRANPSSSTQGMSYTFASANSALPYYIRTYLRIASAPLATTKVMVLQNATPTDVVSIRMTSAGKLQLWNDEDSAQIGSDSAALSTNTWYRVELRFDFGTTATGDSIADARIDGTSFASSTTQNLTTTTGQPARLALGVITTSTSADLFFDDVAINCPGNPSGSASSLPCQEEPTSTGQDFFPGDGSIMYIRPNGNGTNVAWPNCTGTGCVADYTSVDEVTPNDATDYVSCSGSQTEDYALGDVSGTTGTGAVIKLLAAFIRFGAASATTGNNFTLSLGDGTTFDTAQTVTNATATTWFTNDDTSPANPWTLIAATGNTSAGQVEYDKPGTNTDPLTPTGVDSAQVRMTSTDCSPVTNVTAIWVQVEYSAAEGGRIYSSGFELQSTTADLEYTANINTPTISTSTDRTGAASLRANPSASTQGMSYDFQAADDSSDYYFRSYVRFATFPNAAAQIMIARDSGSTDQAAIRFDNVNSTLELWNVEDNAQIGSDSGALSLNVWYRIEMRVDFGTAATGNTTVDFRLDGTSVASSTTVNWANGIMTMQLGSLTTNATSDIFFDDVAINTAQGSVQNSWPGAGAITYLRPNANGDGTAWAVNVNGCAATDYTCVDEVTPNDATDVVGSTTLNQVEEYNLDSSSTGGITSGSTINLVSVGLRFNNSAATLSAVKVRLKDNANAAPIESYNVDNTTLSTYFTNNETKPRSYPITAYTRPNLTTAWTSTDLDNAQIGVRLSVDGGTNNFGVSAMWLLVDYSPPVINISGTCDAYDQTTDCGDTGAVAVAINGTLQPRNQPTVAGTWTIPEVTQPANGDVVTVFIDGASAADRAVSVTKYDGSGDITGFDMFKEHLSIGSADNQTITPANVGQYDNSVSGDADVFDEYSTTFSNTSCTTSTGGSTSCLLVDATGFSSQEELIIKSGNTFQMGALVNTMNIEINGTLDQQTSDMLIAGNWDNNGTLTGSIWTDIFTATSGTKTIDSTGAATPTFAHVQLGQSGDSGTVTFQLSSVWDINGNLTIYNGTLDANSKAITLGGGLFMTGGTDGYSNGSSLTFDGSAANWQDATSGINMGTVVIENSGGDSMTILTNVLATQVTVGNGAGSANTLALGSSGYVMTLTGTGTGASRPFILNTDATFTPGTSTVKFTGGGATTSDVQATTYDGLTIAPGSAGATYNLGTASSQTINTGAFTIGDATNSVTVNWATYDPTLNVGGTFWLKANTTWTKSDLSTAILTLNGSGTSTWQDDNSTKQDAGYITIDGSSKTIQLGSSVTAQRVTIGADDTWNLNGTNTVTLTGNGQTTNRPFIITAGGTFTPGSTSTFVYAPGTAASTDVEGTTYCNIQFNKASTSFFLNNNLVTNDGCNFTITAATVVDAVSGSNRNITVGGNYSNSVLNGLNNRSNTFTMNGTGSQTISGTQNTTYNNLAISANVTSSRGFIVNGTLTIGAGKTFTSNSSSSLGTSGVLTSGGSGAVLAGSASVTIQNQNSTSVSTTNCATTCDLTITVPLQFSSTGTQIIPVRTYGGNVIFTRATTGTATTRLGSGTYTFGGNVNIRGGCDLGVTPSMTLDGATNDPTVNITGTFTVEDYFLIDGTPNCDTINLPDAAATWSVAGNIDMTGTNSFSGGATTIQLNGTSAQSFTTADLSFYKITINNTGTVGTSSDDVTPNGILKSTNTFTLTQGQLRVDVNNFDVQTGGDVAIGANGLVTMATSTWLFNGSGTNTWTDSTSSKQDLGYVSINGTSKTINLGSSVKATRVTIAASQTLGLGSSGYTLTLTGSGTTTSRPFQNSGTLNEGSNSTVKFTGTSATDVYDETWYNLTIAPGGAGSPTYSIGIDGSVGTVVTGLLTVGDGTNTVTLDTNFDTGIAFTDVTIATNGTIKGNAINGWTIAGSLTVNGTFDDNGGSLGMVATTSGKTISGNLTGSSDLGDIQFNGSGGVWTVNSNMDAGGLIVLAGTLIQGANVNFTFTGNVTISSGATFTKASGSGTVLFQGTGASTWTDSNSSKQNIGKVTLTKTNGVSSNNKITLASGALVDTFTISASNTLDLGNSGYTLEIANVGSTATPLTVTGTLTPNSSSTVKFSATNSGGNITVPVQTYASLDVSPGSSETYDVANDMTVSQALTVGTNATLALTAAKTLTLSGTTGTTLTLNGTISGSTARLTYQNTATAFPSSGTISTILRMDASSGDQSIALTGGGGRTLGSDLEIYNSSASNRTLTLGSASSQVLNVSGNFSPYANSTGNMTISGTTNNPTVNITGNLDYLGTGGGSESLISGTGTWTITGNVDLTGSTNPSFSWTGTMVMNNGTSATVNLNAKTLTNFTVNTALTASSTAFFTGTFTVNTGKSVSLSSLWTFGNNGTGTVTINGTGTITGTGTAVFRTSNISTNGTISSNVRFDMQDSDLTAPARAYGSTGRTFTVTTATASAPHTLTFGSAGGTVAITGNLTMNDNSCWGILLDANTDGAGTNDTTVTVSGSVNSAVSCGTDQLSMGSQTWTVGGDFNLEGFQIFNHNSGTLIMNGTGTLRLYDSIGNTEHVAYNVTLSGTITIDNVTNTFAGDLDLRSGTITFGTSNVTMTGSGKKILASSSKAFYTLVMAGSTTIPDTNGADISVTNLLQMAGNDTMTIESTRTVSVTSTSEVSWGNSASTITGAGHLQFTDTSGGPGSGGTISAITRYYTAGGNIASGTFDSRTYGNTVELFNDTSTARTVTCSTGTYTISGASSDFLFYANGTGNITLSCATGNPAFVIGRDFDYVGTNGTGNEAVNASGSGQWSIGRHFDTTGGSWTTTTGNEILMTGTGNLVTNSNLYKLTINGSGNTVTTGSTLTVSNALTIGGASDGDNDTFTINGFVTVTSTGSTTLQGSGTDTINGSGELFSRNGSMNTAGTISVVVVFDSQSGAFTAPGRTFGNDVHFDDNSIAGGHTITLGAGATWNIGGTMYFDCSSCETGGAAEALDGSVNNPTINVTGGFTTSNVLSNSTLSMGSGTWTVGGSFDLTNASTVNHNSGMLVMNGTGTLTSNGKTLNSFTASGSGNVQLASATHTFAGNVSLGSTTFTANSSTVVMTGTSNTLTGGGKTLYSLTIDPSSTGTITLSTSDLTVSNVLTVASGDTFAISGRTVTMTANSGTTLSLSGSITGSTGTLIYRNSATTFPATGTITAGVQLDAVNNSMTVPNRNGSNNFGGALTLYNSSGSSRNFTLSAGTLDVAGNFDMQSTGGTSPIVLVASNNPTVNITGNVTASNASGTYTMNMGTGVWTVGGNFDLSNIGTFNNNSGRLTMNGTSATLTSNGKTLYDLYITNTSGTVTLANATHTLAGDFKMSGAGSTASAGSSTLINMTGSGKVIEGGSRSITGLTITDNTTLQTSDLTTTGQLTVASSKTFTITSVNLTNSYNTDVSWGNGSSTITGTGRLIFTSGAGGPGTGGVVSAITRYDATSGDIASTTIDARTYGASVEPYSNSSTSRTVTLASGTYTLSGSSSGFNPRADGTNDLVIAGDTNNPTMTIGGDVDFTGTGNGYEVLAAGTGTWTVSGNVDLSTGIYGPSVAILSPTATNTPQRDQNVSVDLSCGLINIYGCLGSGTIQFGVTHTGDCAGSATDEDTLTQRGWMEYNPTTITDGVTITSAQIGATVTSTYTSAISVARSTTDDINAVACNSSTGQYAKIIGSTYGTVDFSSTGNKIVPLGTTGVSDVQSRLTGSTSRLSIGFNSSTQEGSMGAISSANSGPKLYAGYTSTTTTTLIMNGASKTLTTAGNGLYNVTFSGTGTTTLADNLTVYGDATFNNTMSAGSTTVTMAGTKTITGGSATLNNLTINPITAGTVTLASSDLTVGGLLTISSSQTLSISSGITLSDTGASDVTLSGTISGSGTLRFTNTSGGPSANGTLSAGVRYDASTNNLASTTVDARTYGGPVELYANSGSARTITFPVSTFTFNGAVSTTSTGGGTLAVDLDANDPNTTFNSSLTIGSTSTLKAQSGATIDLKGNYTNNGTFTHDSGNVTVSGASQQTLAGTMTGSTGQFNNLTISNNSGSDPDSSPSVIFSTGVDTVGTFAATTANVKLRFTAGTTSSVATINFNGQASGTRVYLHSSTPGTQWNINAGAGSRTVLNTSVKDSNACGSTGGDIDGSDSTNNDEGDNSCWRIRYLSVSLSPTSINLGTLSTSSVTRATTVSTVTTNAPSGYVSVVKYATGLYNGTNTFADAAGSITNNVEGYGVSTSQSGQTVATTSGACTSGAGTFNATGLSTTFKQFASATGTVSNDATTMCVQAAIQGSTAAGAYTSTLTVVTTGKF